MRILVNVKGITKKKNNITKVAYDLGKVPHSVKELLTIMVGLCVSQYNEKKQDVDLLKVLSKDDIEDSANSGKVSFGVNYGRQEVTLEESINTALQCFEDGFFAVFVDDERKENLEDSIELHENSNITFVRLTMLAGRIW